MIPKPSGIRKLIIYGFILHLIFFASIFEIYFKSPLIEGLSPLPDLETPPAKRFFFLIVFIYNN